MINVKSSKLIIVVYMSHYLVLLILEFFLARLATLHHGLDSNVTQLLANLLTKPSAFYYLQIVPCIIVIIIIIKLLLLLLLLLLNYCYYYYYYLHMPYVPVRVTRGALVAHRYIYAPPRCRTTQRGSSCG